MPLGCGASGQGQDVLAIAGKVLVAEDEDADDDDSTELREV